jgi:signal recognition particle subunit SRP54
MGDVLGLIEKAEAAFDQQQAQKDAERLLTGDFSLEDFANQLRQVRRMGPIAQVLEMLPGGMGQLARQIDPKDAENQLKMTEAIIYSMTPFERRRPDVNRLIKQYHEAQRLFKNIKKSGMRGLPRLFG